MEQLKHNGLEKDNGCLTLQTCCKCKNQQQESQLSAIAGCQAKNKKTISQDKSCSCEKDIQMRKSSKTSEAVSTSNEKDLKPFYNDLCKEISSRLLSHTEIDSADSVSTSSSQCLTKMVEKSWFSTSLNYHLNKNSQKICSQFFMSSHAGCTVLDGTQTKSRKIRIYPTQEQRILFKKWFGVSRKFYNEAVAFYNEEDKDTVNWMEIAKRLTSKFTEDYVKEVPYQIKKIAVQDCYRAFMNGCRKAKKTGEGFELSFRTRKNPKQSCYIPKSALTINGIYYTIAGNLKITEWGLLNNPFKDLRLVKEYNKWYIVIPITLQNTVLEVSENQRNGDVVALDPGIRTFMTFFTENGYFGKIGSNFNKLLNIQFKIDALISKKDLSKDKKKKRNLYRKIGKLRGRLKSMVDELHWKTINFLVRNFKVIILPTFDTSEMVNKKTSKRKINEKVVRAMQSYRFFEFSERLKNKCLDYGCILIRSNEAYTSKTNSFNGEVFNVGSRKRFKYDGIYVDRDINGARNILLRAMRDSSACGCNVTG